MSNSERDRYVDRNDGVRDRDADANRDPISGAPGAHPVGTGLGAAAGGMAASAMQGRLRGPWVP